MAKDYYDILGVGKNASDDDIKVAFRKAAHKLHPDKPGGDAEKFKEINNAYQTLSDKDKRAKYDQFGAGYEQMNQGGGAGGFGGGFDFSGFQNGQGFDMGDISEMFGGMFGGGGRRAATRGEDIRVDASLDFRDAVFGVERDFSLRRMLRCEDCGGSGAEKGSAIHDCSDCHGTGRVRRAQHTILGTIQTAVACSKCDGTGKIPDKKCRACHGAGVVKGTRNVMVRIPAGIDEGETLRLSGEGEAMMHGGPSGDLYVTMRIKPDAKFNRDGVDIHSVEEISFSQAALGATINAETVDGPVELKVPAGTQPGTVLRLKGKGVTHLRRNARGDQFVTLRVDVPERLTRGQRKALEEWESL